MSKNSQTDCGAMNKVTIHHDINLVIEAWEGYRRYSPGDLHGLLSYAGEHLAWIWGSYESLSDLSEDGSACDEDTDLSYEDVQAADRRIFIEHTYSDESFFDDDIKDIDGARQQLLDQYAAVSCRIMALHALLEYAVNHPGEEIPSWDRLEDDSKRAIAQGALRDLYRLFPGVPREEINKKLATPVKLIERNEWIRARVNALRGEHGITEAMRIVAEDELPDEAGRRDWAAVGFDSVKKIVGEGGGK